MPLTEERPVPNLPDWAGCLSGRGFTGGAASSRQPRLRQSIAPKLGLEHRPDIDIRWGGHLPHGIRDGSGPVLGWVPLTREERLAWAWLVAWLPGLARRSVPPMSRSASRFPRPGEGPIPT